MAIPALSEQGLLPPGRHPCTLSDIPAVFCWNPHRMQLWETFQTFLTWYLPQRPAGQIYLNGSFVTDKAIPDDIDMVTDLSDCDDAELWRALLFLHENQAAIKQRFHVDFWFNFPGGNDLASYFQYVGTKTGAIKGMDSKHHKGILRIIE